MVVGTTVKLVVVAVIVPAHTDEKVVSYIVDQVVSATV
jgi:hypothetical protein